MMSRSLSPYTGVVCAAPSYLAERGTPTHPRDLAAHECLRYPGWSDAQRWSFLGPEGEVQVDVTSRLFINSAFGIRYAALAGAGIVLEMLLEDGLFHADPHPGNIFYLENGGIGLIDFGMVGHVSERRRMQVAQLLYGLVDQDTEAVTDILLDWTEGTSGVDEGRLQVEVGTLIDQYRGLPLKELRIASMLADVAGLLRRHALTLPPDLALMIKAFLTLEGLGRQLDPDFDMATEARPFLRRAMLERWSPRILARRGRRTVSGALDLLGDLPRDLRRVMQAARHGRLRGQIEITSLKAFGDQLNAAANRLTIGVITAALIIGSSIVMNAVGGVPNRWLMAIGVLGFVGAAVTGIWIVLSIWRSGRHR